MSANQVDRLRGVTSGELGAGTLGSFDSYRKTIDAGPVAGHRFAADLRRVIVVDPTNRLGEPVILNLELLLSA